MLPARLLFGFPFRSSIRGQRAIQAKATWWTPKRRSWGLLSVVSTLSVMNWYGPKSVRCGSLGTALSALLSWDKGCSDGRPVDDPAFAGWVGLRRHRGASAS